jgi:hypothetical protein
MINAYDVEGASLLNEVLCALAAKWPKNAE